MKKRLSLILLLAAVTLSGVAQTIGEAFYIYRNDGQFNAFFRDEVQSIEYSYYDADSVKYEEIVTQVVITADSVYKIPLAAIDSVGFVQPETILQPNVVQMAQNGLMGYLKAVDGMTLLFKTTIPNELRPKVDNVLLYTDFESPLLKDGFAGKVLKTEMTTDAFRVECDSIYDIFDIFEQLTSIEVIGDDNNAIARRRIDGEWNPGKKPLNFNLGYSHDLSDGEVSLSGSVNGAYAVVLIYNITREEQYFNLRINHDWQYSAHLNFKAGKSFGTLIGPVFSLPAIRFPAVAPVFKFQIAGAPFVKGEGNMELDFSLNSPVQSYVAQVVYNNGTFSGWNHRQPSMEGNMPSFEAAFSLNGSLQIGYMVDFWLGLDISIKGIAKDFLKLGTGLDLYIGPKLTGDFSMKLGTENPVNYYSTFKDSKFDLSLLTVDYEFFGEAALAGHKTPKGIFCNGTVQSPWNHEWYLMPEFSDLTIQKDEEELSATISCTPSRDILFPLELGMGIYDETGKLDQLAFETTKYKREDEGYTINQSFYSLEREKEYEARPMIKILGGEVSAFPTKKFKFEEAFPVALSDFKVTKSQYEKGGFTHDGVAYDYRFDVAVTATLGDVADEIVDWGYMYQDPFGNPPAQISLKKYGSSYTDTRWAYFRNEPKSTCTLYGYVKYVGSNEAVYGEPHDYPLEYKSSETFCPDSNHPHWIDLGIGTLWRCCNAGASSPEGYGSYYTFDQAQAHNPPSLEQIKALVNNSKYEWINQNGVKGGKFTGPNGVSIFFPAAGDFSSWGELFNVGWGGRYWSSTSRDDGCAYSLDFAWDYHYWWGNDRVCAQSVRPVQNK